MPSENDPLGVRAGARFVLERARDVSIDSASIQRVARQIIGQSGVSLPWSPEHLGDRQLSDDELANFVLVLDALNFYFWGEPRWKVHWHGETHDGYRALTVALQRALDEGFPITDAEYLATIPAHDVATILRGESIIPEFAARVHHLREAGQALLRSCDASFFNCVRSADRSATDLLRQVITLFPSFVDVSSYQSRVIPFYKRAQILVSDLSGAFAASPAVRFIDLQVLTAFADYKVPQVLHQLGVLRYSPKLVHMLDTRTLVVSGTPAEVEIRAATILAVERIAAELRALGQEVNDFEVDWYLWNLGQDISSVSRPYHRTPTTAY